MFSEIAQLNEYELKAIKKQFSDSLKEEDDKFAMPLKLYREGNIILLVAISNTSFKVLN